MITSRDRAAAVRDPDLDFLLGDAGPRLSTVALLFKPEAFRRLCWWIVERDRIKVAKDAGLQKPWSDNEFMQQARWCNVCRMHDRVSQYLLNVWYADDLLASHAQIAVNAAMARLINRIDTLEELRAAGQNVAYDSATTRAVLEARRDRRRPKVSVFSGAYIVSGIPGEDKVTTVVGQLDQIFEAGADLIDPTSMERTSLRLQEIEAIGSFMAGQIVADLRFIYRGTWADRNAWAPLGPGSEEGLAYLRGWNGIDSLARFGIAEANFSASARQVRDQLNAVPAVREVLDRVGAELMDIQNCLCEFSKLSRYAAGLGKPKNKYPGRHER